MKVGIEVMYFNIIKVIYDKPILPNGENLNPSLLNLKEDQDAYSHGISST